MLTFEMVIIKDTSFLASVSLVWNSICSEFDHCLAIDA